MRLTLNVPLKIEEEIEVAVKFFNDTIQWAGWMKRNARTYRHMQDLPMPYTNKTKNHRKIRLRRSWHQL
jgi:hypothetical protein